MPKSAEHDGIAESRGTHGSHRQRLLAWHGAGVRRVRAAWLDASRFGRANC